MTMTVEIPFELQPLVAAAVSHGRFANEQELFGTGGRDDGPESADRDGPSPT